MNPGVIEFREKYLTPGYLMSQLEKNQKALINIPAGAGKTSLARKLVTDPNFTSKYAIIYLADTRAILDEFHDVKNYTSYHQGDVVVLTRRPRLNCGLLDERWSSLEATGNSEYARATLCEICPHYPTCEWRLQFKPETLENRRIIYGVTDYLFLVPRFIQTVMNGNSSKKVLLVIDEPGIVTRDLTKSILPNDLKTWNEVLKEIANNAQYNWTEKQTMVLEKWIDFGKKLKSPKHSISERLTILPRNIVLSIQETALLRNSNFKYLGNDLQTLSSTHPLHRWWDHDTGMWKYLAHPRFPSVDVLIMGAGLDEELVNLRLNRVDIRSVLPVCPPSHPSSKILNLQSSATSKYNFSRHGEHLLEVLATPIATMITEGKRILLISKKCFIPSIKISLATILEEKLGQTVAITEHTEQAPGGALQIPIINYGIVGVNTYEAYDCAVCLNAYYLSSNILKEKIYETLPETRGLDFSIVNKGNRRTVYPEPDIFRYKYYKMVANKVLHLFETLVVEQAIARVRHINYPRTVLVANRSRFQVPISAEFKNIYEFRKHYSIPTQRKSIFIERIKRARMMAISGLEVKEIATQIGVSVSSVYKYLGTDLE